MSRIGKKPITIPQGIDIDITGDAITVRRGDQSLSQKMLPGIAIKVDDGVIHVERENEARETRALHGLMRSLVNNMVIGLNEGFTKNLEIQGVGYRAQKQATNDYDLGYSPGDFEERKHLSWPPDTYCRKGADKQLVGEMALRSELATA